MSQLDLRSDKKLFGLEGEMNFIYIYIKGTRSTHVESSLSQQQEMYRDHTRRRAFGEYVCIRVEVVGCMV